MQHGDSGTVGQGDQGKEGNIRIQGFVTRVAIKGGATRTDLLRTDPACNTVKDGAIAVY